ncbi:hypothetical protein HaLaN_04130, partial [Haematococcus lacustris]
MLLARQTQGPACNATVLRRCSAAVSQCRPVRPARKLACSAKAMVNVDFASPSLVRRPTQQALAWLSMKAASWPGLRVKQA